MDDTRFKIVLVDDTITSLVHGQNLLKAFYKVYTMQSAAILFEYLKNDIPDLILLDVMMPEMDGFETLSILKADERYRDIPVMFLTSKSDEESERKGFSLGAVDYITKPFSAPVLQKRISNHILYSQVQGVVKHYSDSLEVMVDEISELDERTKILLDKTPLCCQLWDRSGKTIDCNEAAVNLYGFTSKQEYVEKFSQCCSPKYQPDGRRSDETIAALVNQAFEEGYCSFDWMHQMPDGTPMPAEVVLVRVKYNDDYLVAAYTRDLREHKAIIEEMRRAELAEENSKAKSRFLANISHEIRTPMNVIVGLTELLLEEDSLPEHVIDSLKKIDTAGITLMGLVNDVLDISKIESGKFTLTLERYDVASLFSSIISINLIRTDNKPVSFRFDIDGDMFAELYGDDLRVKQILNNLLSNAFKYTHSGTVALAIKCERTGDNDVMLSMTVSDTGIGMRSEDFDNIFAAYYQLDKYANRHIEGTGLGLSITKSLTELMCGDISVESEYGKGTVFRLKIRQGFVSDERIGEDKAAELRAFRYERRKTPRKLVRPDLSYVKVLVVDDFPTNLDVARGLLGKYNIHVDCVESGQEAVDRIILGEPVYDAVFMDHMMPGMDGIEATQLIRALGTKYAENLTIIALTANAISENERMFLDNGFNAFLSKPVNVARMDAAVRQWIMKEDILPPMTAGQTAADPGVSAQAPGAFAQDSGFSAQGLEFASQGSCFSAQDTEFSSLPSAPTVGIPGIDTDLGLSLYDGDMEMYTDILRSFAENIPPEAEKLHNVTAQNLRGYAIDAHTIKGSAASIGAEHLAANAKHMETMAKSGNLTGVLAENTEFIGEIDTLVAGIEQWLRSIDL